MTAESSSSSSQASAFRSHVEWLNEMRNEYAMHQREMDPEKASSSPAQVGQDKAEPVGSGRYEEYDEDDDKPVYRSMFDLALEDPDAHSRSEHHSRSEAILDFSDEPLYRSLPLQANAQEADQAWVAQARPPLVKRQRGFAVGSGFGM